MAKIEIHVPDIGDFTNIPVIEIAVAPGDTVQAEDPLVTLESDKATMDVPAPEAGTIVSIAVSVGDEVSEGTLIGVLETETDAAAKDAQTTDDAPDSTADEDDEPPPAQVDHMEVCVPDIGEFSDIPVIEIMVAPGDTVSEEDPLVTLESDKATMDVPAPAAGTIREVLVRVGDTVSEGSALLIMDPASGSAAAQPAPIPVAAPAPQVAPAPAAAAPSVPQAQRPARRPAPTADMQPSSDAKVAHASPAIRRFARELGVDLSMVTGTGRKGRVVRDDIKAFIKAKLSQPASSASTQASQGGMGIAPIPAVDFSKFGPIESQPLSRIQRLSGPHLHRSWLNVPHVTHHDEADITELEAFRQSIKSDAAKRDVRVTALSFIMKALQAGLREFPNFNASLSPDGQELILKQYFHIGVAVDTPGGLVVPVIRDVDKKSIYDISAELADVSVRARESKLKPDDLQGGCISISSLGGIGGTAFTPIVNAPEVAILGVARSKMQPVWNGSEFEPRLMLPLDLSYDHRVIDGAAAARFVAYLTVMLSDVRKLLL